jgi:hypothetical protein
VECLGLHNEPKAAVHPGYLLTGPKEEEEWNSFLVTVLAPRILKRLLEFGKFVHFCMCRQYKSIPVFVMFTLAIREAAHNNGCGTSTHTKKKVGKPCAINKCDPKGGDGESLLATEISAGNWFLSV